MYGLVNRAIEQLVVSLRGEAGWERVCHRAGVDCEGFVAMSPYQDDITYRLVAAVSHELDMPASQVLEAFGEYWVRYTADEGYGELMNSGGTDLRSFLANLNAMHGRIESVLTQMRLPRFRVEDLPGGDFLLHYESERRGLAPMVIGLVRGLAARFGQVVQIEHLHVRGEDAGPDVFRVRCAAAPMQ